MVSRIIGFIRPGSTLLLLQLCLFLPAILLAQRPYVTSSFPHNDAENLPCNTFVKANVFFPSEGKILDPVTFHDKSVRLFPKGNPRRTVEAARLYDEEHTFLTLVPKEVLHPFTTYVFEVTADLVDERGFSFLPFSLEFQTDGCDQKPTIARGDELPIEEPELPEMEVPNLMDFQAKWVGDSIQLSWQTDRYWPLGELTLQYANSQMDFQEQHNVQVEDNIFRRQRFGWTDDSPVWGWNYYRLAFMGVNGEHFITDTLKMFRPRARFSRTEFSLNETLSIEFLLEKTSTMAFILKTRSGKILKRKAGMLPAGEQIMTIPLQGIQPGSYIAILRTQELTLAEVIRILAE
ncbi:MAG: Ig-like domain-containing protein [Bacteroidota bacterium]